MSEAEFDRIVSDGRADMDALVELAISLTRGVEVDRVFKLRDLFEGYKWDSLKKIDRHNLGRNFKGKVESGKVDSVICVGRDSSTIYKKVEKAVD